MRNKFIENPGDDIIVDVEHQYSISDGIMHVGVEDYHAAISGADNVIILEGQGLGNNRVSNALEDAVLHTCRTAPGYDLFSAENVIIKLIYPKEKQLMMNEMVHIIDFYEMFPNQQSFIWGISETSELQTDVIAIIVASNLKKKA